MVVVYVQARKLKRNLFCRLGKYHELQMDPRKLNCFPFLLNGSYFTLTIVQNREEKKKKSSSGTLGNWVSLFEIHNACLLNKFIIDHLSYIASSLWIFSYMYCIYLQELISIIILGYVTSMLLYITTFFLHCYINVKQKSELRT